MHVRGDKGDAAGVESGDGLCNFCSPVYCFYCSEVRPTAMHCWMNWNDLASTVKGLTRLSSTGLCEKWKRRAGSSQAGMKRARDRGAVSMLSITRASDNSQYGLKTYEEHGGKSTIS